MPYASCCSTVVTSGVIYATTSLCVMLWKQKSLVSVHRLAVGDLCLLSLSLGLSFVAV